MSREGERERASVAVELRWRPANSSQLALPPFPPKEGVLYMHMNNIEGNTNCSVDVSLDQNHSWWRRIHAALQYLSYFSIALSAAPAAKDLKAKENEQNKITNRGLKKSSVPLSWGLAELRQQQHEERQHSGSSKGNTIQHAHCRENKEKTKTRYKAAVTQ